MRTIIYYFSGTGNSLSVARKLSGLIQGDVDVQPIAPMTDKPIEINSDVLGFVFPVYFQSMPDILAKFIRKIQPIGQPYTFAVATCNAAPGHSLFTIGKRLKKVGLPLHAGFSLDMPGNSLIVRDYTNPPAVQKHRLKQAEGRIQEISDCVNARRVSSLEGRWAVKDYFRGVITGTFAKYIYKTPTKFIASDRCMSCGAWRKVCPVNNIITDNDGHPQWGKNCTQCLACFHWCPATAIEIGKTTIGKKRYTNPDVSLKDIVCRE